jgi:PAT family beta-lactamase induction signal transducer AmpG
MKGKLPPVWLLGMGFVPFGLFTGFLLFSLPQLLAARGVPEPTIAWVTGTATIPSFTAFLISPMLDVWMSRRRWSLVMLGVMALALLAAPFLLASLPALTLVLFLGFTAAILYFGAIGGWFGGLVPAEQEASLGAWLTVGNTGAFGVMTAVAAPLLQALPVELAAAAMALSLALPALLFAYTPSTPPSASLVSENFARFFAELAVVLRRPSVLRLLLVFVLPAASFALTNTLGGLGADYHASEVEVSLFGGLGTTIAAILGSLLVPPLARRFAPITLYLLIGGAGCLFTLSLILLPHAPVIFALAITLQNVFQAAAFSTENAVQFREIGKNNPFAATQFSLFSAAASFPITYMQFVDGQAYGAGGLARMYATDGLLGLAAVGAIVLLLLVTRRRPAFAA